MTRISYRQARAQRSKGPEPRWSAIIDDFEGEVWPDFTPSFRIARGETVFTIGSCFARNIERHLADLGCRVPMLDLALPAEEADGEPNGALNRFHPPAFRQILAWTARIAERGGHMRWDDCAPFAFDCGDGRFIDTDIGVRTPVPLERLIERRHQLYQVFSEVFSAGCLMLTPGLIEAWRDRATGLYLHEAPLHKAMAAQKRRWELQVLSYGDCLTAMLDSVDIVRARNPGVKVLITTSPVPMATTFSGQDVRVANGYSKAVLRAVCGAAAGQRPLVDYFPSYESVALSHPEGVWAPDRLHVASAFIGKIVTRMLNGYVEGLKDADLALQRARTALAEADHAAAEAAARQVLESLPRQRSAALLLAEALLRQDRLRDAEAILRPLADAEPSRPDVWFALGRTLSRDKARTAEALEAVFRGAALPDPPLEALRGVWGLVRRRAGEAGAEQLARRAVELYPNHIEAHRMLADVLEDHGRVADAAKVMATAVGLRRLGAEDLVRYAGLLQTLGRTDKARAAVARALELAPGHPGALELDARLATRVSATA